MSLADPSLLQEGSATCGSGGGILGCTCDTVCTCNQVCTCDTVAACTCDSEHYWYPN